MITCDRVKQLLSEFLDNQISPDLRVLMETHFQNCPDCNLLLEDVKFVTHRLNTVQQVKSTEQFDQQLRTRILNEPGADKKKSSIPFQRLSYGLSGIAVLVILYFVVFTNFESSSNPAPELPVIQRSGTLNQSGSPQPQPTEMATKNPAQTPAGADSVKLEPTQINPNDIDLVDEKK